MRNLALLLVTPALLFSTLAFAAREPLALVWKGPGTCKPNCAIAAGSVANLAGLRVIYVTIGFHDYKLLESASVWIQPGGKSDAASKAMGPELLQHIHEFVKQGGGYVGFCAGLFLSTKKIADTEQDGLDLVPGTTDIYLQDDPPATLVRITDADGPRWVYYAGGPFLKLTEDEIKANQVSVKSRYDDGSIAAVNLPYGSGHVAVSGFHPEASRLWKIWKRLRDPDGSDRDIAVSMIHYAIGKTAFRKP